MREYDPAHVQLMAELPEAGRIDALRAVHRNSQRPAATARPDRRAVDGARHPLGAVHHRRRDHVGPGLRAGAADGSFRHVLAVCRLASGAHAMVEFDDAGFAYEVSVEVLGADGRRAHRRPDAGHCGAARARSTPTSGPTGSPGSPRPIAPRTGPGSTRSGRAWRSVPSTWDGLVAHAVVEAILESLATGESVAVEPLSRPDLYASCSD